MPARPERPLPDYVVVIIVVVLATLALLPRCMTGAFPQSYSASSISSPREGAKLAR